MLRTADIQTGTCDVLEYVSDNIDIDRVIENIQAGSAQVTESPIDKLYVFGIGQLDRTGHHTVGVVTVVMPVFTIFSIGNCICIVLYTHNAEVIKKIVIVTESHTVKVNTLHAVCRISPRYDDKLFDQRGNHFGHPHILVMAGIVVESIGHLIEVKFTGHIEFFKGINNAPFASTIAPGTPVQVLNYSKTWLVHLKYKMSTIISYIFHTATLTCPC